MVTAAKQIEITITHSPHCCSKPAEATSPFSLFTEKLTTSSLVLIRIAIVSRCVYLVAYGRVRPSTANTPLEEYPILLLSSQPALHGMSSLPFMSPMMQRPPAQREGSSDISTRMGIDTI